MKNVMKLVLALLIASTALSQLDRYKGRKFEQLGTELATPNVYRTASGAPGHKYWQQKADYVINVEIDDENQILRGSETITYTNNSPDVLTYLWVQLDQNVREKNSFNHKASSSKIRKKMSTAAIDRVEGYADYDGGHKITKLTDANGKSLKYTINYTMMRIDLPKALNPGEKFVFNVDWHYNINDRDRLGGRGGHNYFKKDDNHIYTITQWFPRMAVYSDFDGWQNKQFMGRGEFALVFGDYDVKITVPADHIVASTGELQNPEKVLTKTQRDRLKKARTAKEPVKIVTRKEALRNQKSKSSKKKTWHYKAKNVRDFAFGSSRKFIWDAMGVHIKDKKEYWESIGRAEENGVKDNFTWAMSYYADEAYETYEKYSTHAVAHTLESYSKHTIPYPYPVAISVEAANGMEYPMICFNYGRPASDGTYSERTKYGMIGVIIHEIGHFFFPMIVNSDERQWTWMDEGLNTFSQFVAETEWEHNHPSRRGPAHNMVRYMKGDKSNISPIMTNSEQVKQFGNNAYGKPATALNILRETILGRELFDFAYKTYARRWAFKHPTPEDFFRTMEDASGVDLDWFWKGWFFSTNHVDISIENVTKYNIDTKDPEIENKIKKQKYWRNRTHIANERNKNIKTYVDKRPHLNDFYNKWDRHEPRDEQEKAHKKFVKSLDKYGKEMLDRNPNFYEVTFNNVGGLVMPIIIEFTYEDGSKEVEYLPAEIWRKNEEQVTRVFVKDKVVTQFSLDPYRETADVDENNNFFPPKIIPSRFEMFKRNRGARGASGKNPMQKYGKKK